MGYTEPKQTQIDSVKELVEEGNLNIVLHGVEMKDQAKLNIVSVLFDNAEEATFSKKVLKNEYSRNELIEYLCDNEYSKKELIEYLCEDSDTTIFDIIKYYKLNKREKRAIICDFLGVNHLTTNEEIKHLIDFI